MKISINGIEIVKNKDFASASIRSSQDYMTGPTYIDLTIYGLPIDVKAFTILDTAFRNAERINVKFLSEGCYGFSRDLNMMVRSEDIVCHGYSDIPSSSFNLEATA